MSDSVSRVLDRTSVSLGAVGLGVGPEGVHVWTPVSKFGGPVSGFQQGSTSWATALVMLLPVQVDIGIT